MPEGAVKNCFLSPPLLTRPLHLSLLGTEPAQMELEIEPAMPEQNLGGNDFESRFGPFVRRDVCGRFGFRELPRTEKLLSVFALMVLGLVRLVLAACLLAFYYLVCRVCTLFQKPHKDGSEQEDYAHLRGWRRAVIVCSGKFMSRIFLFLLGFYRISEINLQPQVAGNSGDESEGIELPEAHGRPGAIISNHVSYIDIVYHISSSFPSFVAERSVAKLPLVSLICKCLGCIYVKRETKPDKGISGVVDRRMKKAHRNRDAPLLMVFPESTTTNGDFLLPFKTSAFLPKVPVLPVVLKYHYRRFSPASESISGVWHGIYLLCQFVNYMEVIRLPVYYPSLEEIKDPRLYANNVRRLMATQGQLELSDLGLAEKKAYRVALTALFESH